VIRQFAQHNAFDLLVLGTAYHHRGGDMFLGSTAEQVLTNAQCSLMFVKPLA
jgi:universal stress protein E